jgi:dolichol-phosphate mannosyltransferase
MSLSVIIPCYNEEGIIKETANHISKSINKIEHEIIIIDDFSTDNTKKVLIEISKSIPNIKIIQNEKKGLGPAINLGITTSSKKYVCIFMADMSDDVKDLINYYNIIKEKDLDAIMGSRFLKESTVLDYPFGKLILNRIFNLLVRFLFLSRYNDYTNAFKIYKKESLLKLKPFVSENFNIFLEIPLKIISRKCKFIIIPINWYNRKIGKSKFKIKELGSKYLFTLLYCWLEKILLKK